MTADILSALRTLSGVNVECGLDMARQPSAHLDLLRDFVGEHRHFALLFLVLLDSGRHDEAHHLVHTLKGTAGFFGLTAIHASAGTLEATIRDGTPEDETIAMIIAIADAVDGLAAAIGGCL